MQFREQGKKIQVLAYRGYDREKKRAQVKLLGSLDRWSLVASDQLLNSLTDDEKNELTAYIENVRRERDESRKKYHLQNVVHELSHLGERIRADAVALELGAVDAGRADEAWIAIRAIETLLKKSGFPRPTRSYKKRGGVDQAVDDRQQTMI